jgi:hypothetical protein
MKALLRCIFMPNAAKMWAQAPDFASIKRQNCKKSHF